MAPDGVGRAFQLAIDEDFRELCFAKILLLKFGDPRSFSSCHYYKYFGVGSSFIQSEDEEWYLCRKPIGIFLLQYNHLGQSMELLSTSTV